MDARFVALEGEYVAGTVDVGVYGLEPILKAAYLFSGEYFVHLQRGDAGRIEVRLRARSAGADLERAFGAFVNEVLDQGLRAKIAAETAPVRNLILAHALSGTTLLRAELEAVEPPADPEGVGAPDNAKPTA